MKETKSTSVTLTWEKVTGAARYEVYRSATKNGTYSKVGSVYTTSYQDTGLERETTYYYKVRAISAVSAANSANSPVINATTRKTDLPSVSVYMMGESEPNSMATIYVTNRGDYTLRFYAEGGRWIDGEYTDYDRDVKIYDSDAIMNEELVELEYLDIGPKESAILCVVADSVIRYDENLTTIQLDMSYDGISYTSDIRTTGLTYKAK